MHETAKHFPGCYHNLPCEPRESLAGYLLRLAEANGYRGIRDLLRLQSSKVSGPLRPQLLQLLTDGKRLSGIASMAVGDATHLERFYAQPLPLPSPGTPTEALYIHERRVNVDALLPVRAAVCPRCLIAGGHTREEWDLAPVTVCVEHETSLIDECQSCRAPITWDRPHLFHCANCAADFRSFEGIRAQQMTTAVAAHFQALAPFRVVDYQRRVLVVDWEEMFHTFKALMLPDSMWVADTFPASYVADTSVERRHAVIEQLAQVLVDSRYEVSNLCGKATKALAPLVGLPIQKALEEVAMRYLVVEAGLSNELSAALVREQTYLESIPAADVFAGHPPTLRTVGQVERFLDASTDEVTRLIRIGIIAPRMNSLIGHDADHVLRARRFLDSLLNVDDLSKVVGVPVRDADLHPDGLFPRWNPEARSDNRVMPERVIELQRLLAMRWHQAQPPKAPVSLRALAQSSDRAFDCISHVVQQLIYGVVENFSWGPPFAWADIAVCRDALSRCEA